MLGLDGNADCSFSRPSRNGEKRFYELFGPEEPPHVAVAEACSRVAPQSNAPLKYLNLRAAAYLN